MAVVQALTARAATSRTRTGSRSTSRRSCGRRRRRCGARRRAGRRRSWRSRRATTRRGGVHRGLLGAGARARRQGAAGARRVRGGGRPGSRAAAVARRRSSRARATRRARLRGGSGCRWGCCCRSTRMRTPSSASSKLRGGTVLSMPEVAAARENDTLAKLAKELGRPVQAFVDLNAESIEGVTATTKLKKNSLVLVPPRRAGRGRAARRGEAGAGAAAGLAVARRDAARRGRAGRRGSLGAVGGAPAVGRRQVRGVHRRRRGVHRGVRDGRRAQGVAAQGRAAGGGGARAARQLPSVGDEIQAEVNDDDGRTRWRDAEVRRLLEGGRFECCIDGDEDFNEEYGMADEGTEWRLKPPADASVPRAHEWVKQEFVRPPVRAPEGYLDAATAGTTLQLWFDSAWWRATLLGRDQPSEADLAVAEAEAIAGDRAGGGRRRRRRRGRRDEAAAARRAPPPPPRRRRSHSRCSCSSAARACRCARRKRVRPDWKWSDGAWKLPPNARAIAATSGGGGGLGGSAPSPGRAAGERLAASSAGKPPATHAGLRRRVRRGSDARTRVPQRVVGGDAARAAARGRFWSRLMPSPTPSIRPNGYGSVDTVVVTGAAGAAASRLARCDAPHRGGRALGRGRVVGGLARPRQGRRRRRPPQHRAAADALRRPRAPPPGLAVG